MKRNRGLFLLLTGLAVSLAPSTQAAEPGIFDSVKTFTGRIRMLGPHVQRNSADFNEGYRLRAYDLIAEAERKLLKSPRLDEPLLAATVELAAEVARFDGSLDPADSIFSLRSKFPGEFEKALASVPVEGQRRLRASLQALDSTLQNGNGG